MLLAISRVPSPTPFYKKHFLQNKIYSENSQGTVADLADTGKLLLHFNILNLAGLGSRIRSRKISTGSVSGSYRYLLWQCKVVKTRKKYFKNRTFTHFQVNFSIFQIKIISNIGRNMFDVNKIQMFEFILGKCQQDPDLDPDPVF